MAGTIPSRISPSMSQQSIENYHEMSDEYMKNNTQADKDAVL